MGHTFPFLCMFLIFLLLDNWTFESNNYVTLEISFSPFHRACWLSCNCFWFCLLVIVSCVCRGSAWAIIWRFFSERFPECMWSCSDLSLICSCFWMSQSLISGFQKREKRKMKEGDASHLNSLEVTPTWRRRGMPQCGEVLLQSAPLWSSAVRAQIPGVWRTASFWVTHAVTGCVSVAPETHAQMPALGWRVRGG